MLSIVLVTIFTIVLPLCLCLVPSLAKYTVFPLLSKLVYKFTKEYVLPTLEVAYCVEQLTLKKLVALVPNRRFQHCKSSRFVTISLRNLQLRPEYLKSLQLVQTHLVPFEIEKLQIAQIQLHVTSPWRVWMDVSGVKVTLQVANLQQNSDQPLFDLQQVVQQKLETANALTSALQKELMARCKQAVGSATATTNPVASNSSNSSAESAPSLFSLKDRILQYVVAQMEIQVHRLEIELQNQHLRDAATASSRSFKALLLVETLALSSSITASESLSDSQAKMSQSDSVATSSSSEDEESAPDDGAANKLDRILVSSDPCERHCVRVEELALLVADEKASECSGSVGSRQDLVASGATLLHWPELLVQCDVPPLLRLLDVVQPLVPNTPPPIVLHQRIAKVQVVIGTRVLVELHEKRFVELVEAVYAPLCDLSARYAILQQQERVRSGLDVLSPEDEQFYLQNYTFEPVADTKIAEKLVQLEQRLPLATIVELRSQVLNWPTLLTPNASGNSDISSVGQSLTLEQIQQLQTEIQQLPENQTFCELGCSIAAEELVASVVNEEENQVATLALEQIGINYLMQVTSGRGVGTDSVEHLVSRPQAAETKQASEQEPVLETKLDFELGRFGVKAFKTNVDDTRELALVFVDEAFGTTNRSVADTKLCRGSICVFTSGLQTISVDLNGLQVALEAELLELLLLFVDRQLAHLHQVFALVTPMPSEPVGDASTPTSSAAGVSSSAWSSSREQAEMAAHTLFHGRLLQWQLRIEGFGVALHPDRTFSLGHLVADQVNDSDRHEVMMNPRLQIVCGVHCRIESGERQEVIQVEAAQLGILAHFGASSDPADVESPSHEDRSETPRANEDNGASGAVEELLMPTTVAFLYESCHMQAPNGKKAKDSKLPDIKLTCTLRLPDLSLCLSDFSLALGLNCLGSLGQMQLSTAEQTQLKHQSEKAQRRLQQKMELEGLLGRLRHVFEQIDQDHNGKLDGDELKQLFRKAQLDTTLLESELSQLASSVLQEIDQDGNGSIEMDELIEYAKEGSGRTALDDDDLDEDPDEGDAKSKAHPNALGKRHQVVQGLLDLRAGEYASFDELERLFGSKAGIMLAVGRQEFARLVQSPLMRKSFWERFDQEIGEIEALKPKLHGHVLITTQKKLVRLLQNYDAAEICWEALVQPKLESIKKAPSSPRKHGGDHCTSLSGGGETLDWLLNTLMSCGGLCEYQMNARDLFLKRSEELFGAMASTNSNSTATTSPSADGVNLEPKEEDYKPPKSLWVAMDVQLGTLKVMLLDPWLPTGCHRGQMTLEVIKCALDLKTTELQYVANQKWLEVADSMNSEGSLLFGLQLGAACFNERANSMEQVLEPWQLMAAVSSNLEENGVSTLVEADKKFQVNVTPAFLKVYQTVTELAEQTSGSHLVANAQSAAKRLQLLQFGKRKRATKDVLVVNATGVGLVLQLSGGDQLELAPDQRQYIKSQAFGQQLELASIGIKQWGTTLSDKVALKSFGALNLMVPNAQDTASIMVTAWCRLDNPRNRSLVLESSLYVLNHSVLTMDVKFLRLGCGALESITSPVLTVHPNAKLELPLSVLMGMTEFYIRPQGFDEWVTKVSLNNDLLVSKKAMEDNAVVLKKKPSFTQRRSTIVFAHEEGGNASLTIKQLAPNVVLQRLFQRQHLTWEISLLSTFVIRNSLPYTIEYRFLEYRSQSKNIQVEFAKLESVLGAADDEPLPQEVHQGQILSGQDGEVSGISGLLPGYVVFRVTSVTTDSTSKSVKAHSKWSMPLLMAIHSPVKQFQTTRQEIDLADGVVVHVDRLSLPNRPRVMRLWSSLWIVNSTSLKFAVAPVVSDRRQRPMPSSQQFDKPQLPSLGDGVDHVAVTPVELVPRRPRAWDSLGRVPLFVFDKEAAQDCVFSLTPDATTDSAAWSAPINASAVNTNGEILCGTNVFGVKIEGVHGIFEGSTCVTLTPRFCVQNRLDESIWCQLFASSETVNSKANAAYQKALKELQPQQDNNPLFPAGQRSSFKPFSLESGETVPAYHFPPLRRGESIAHAQKYLVVAAGADAPNAPSSWSFALPVHVAGDLYFQVYSPTKKRFLICQASIQVIDMYVYVILSDASLAPPYRIENFTPFTVNSKHLMVDESGISLFSFQAQVVQSEPIKSGTWRAFAWPDPGSKDRKMEFFLEHNRGTKAKTQKKVYDIDFVGAQEHLWMEMHDGTHAEVVVQVIVDENTRVLQFLPKEYEEKGLETQQLALETEFKMRRMLFACSFDAHLAGLGVSFIDFAPQEVFLLSIDTLRFRKRGGSLSYLVSIHHVQMDNMLTNARYAVILNPVNSGYSSKSNTDEVPVFQVLLEADLVARIGVYRLLEAQLSTLALKVDVDYLVGIVKLLEQFVVSETAQQKNSVRTLHRLVDARVPAVPVDELFVDGNIRHDMVYFESLRIHAFALELEYAITRKDIVGTGDSSGSILSGILSQVLALVGSNLGGSPTFSFSEVVIVRCFSTKNRLTRQLVQNFVVQLISQAYRLVASVDIIGNPIGLVEDLGSGVIEFLKITKDEVLGDTQTRGEGVKVLGKTIIKTGASSLAKITGSLDKFVTELGEEPPTSAGRGQDGQEPRDPSLETTANLATGFEPIDGGLRFAKEFGKGITGIFTKPVEGARKGGVSGLVQGTVSGIAGPGVVLLKQITSTSHTIAVGVQDTVVDRSLFGGRRRAARKFDHGLLVCDPNGTDSSISPSSDEQELDSKTAKAPSFSKMTLEVIGANGLIGGSSTDSYCVVKLERQQVLQTKVLYGTANPLWKEKKEIAVSSTDLAKRLRFEVKESYGGGAFDHTIGSLQVTIQQLQQDFAAPEYGSTLCKWVKTGVKPEETKLNVSNVVKDREYNLLAAPPRMAKTGSSVTGLLLGTSSNNSMRQLMDGFQLVVTVVGMHDFEMATHSGGFLGLTNLLSSSYLAPYVNVTFGAMANSTAAVRIDLAGKKDASKLLAASWNETFTFPFVAADFGSSMESESSQMHPSKYEVKFAVRDRSLLQEDTLGVAKQEVTRQEMPQEQELELALFNRSRQSRHELHPVGKLRVKLQVTRSMESLTPPLHSPTASSESAAPTTKAMLARSPSLFGETTGDGDEEEYGIRVGKLRLACGFA